MASFLTAVLVAGLLPAPAFAAQDSLSLIPEGGQGAVRIASSAEGNTEEFSHCLSDGPRSADAGSAATAPTDVTDMTDGGATADMRSVEDPSLSALPMDIIDQVMPLETIAQGESTRSYLLAQTLGSERTVPVVNASLPLDTGTGPVDEASNQDSENAEGFDARGIIAAGSMVVGSFEHLGMTFAIETGGESVALMALDYNKLPISFIQDQIVSIPETAIDGSGYPYSVTRIADRAFSTLTRVNADPGHMGCDAFLSDGGRLSEADIDPHETATIASLLKGRTGILILGIPASVTDIADSAFVESDTVRYLVVSENEVCERLRLVDPHNAHGDVIEVISAPEDDEVGVSAKTKLLTRMVNSARATMSGGALADASSSALELSTGSAYAAANSRQARFDSNGGSMYILWAPLDSADFQTYATNQTTWPLYWENEVDCYMAAAGDVYWVSRYRGDELLDVTLRWALGISRPGYTLTGWKTQGGELWSVNSFTTRTIPGGTHFTAQWMGDPHVVSFDANGGTGGQTATVTANYGAAMPGISTSPPARLGYRFDGWWDTPAASGGTQYYTSAGASARTWDKTNAATLYARWVKESPYQAHFWAEGGSIHIMRSPIAIDAYATHVTSAPDWPVLWYPDTYAILNYHGQVYWASDHEEYTPTSHFEKWFLDARRPGYKLLGWKDGSGALWGTGAFDTKDLVSAHFYAQWEPAMFTVSFDANGGSGGQSSPVAATFDAVMPGISTVAPTRAGYTFAGWWDVADAVGGTQYYTDTGASVRTWDKDANATLYARWTPNARYTVSFDVNGGVGGQAVDVTAVYGMSMPAISSVAPTRAGYIFAGWWDTDAPAGGTQYYTDAGASARAWDKAANATLYARWTPRAYAVAWDAQGGNVMAGADVTSQVFGGVLKVPANPTRYGYAFDGWWTTDGSDPFDPGTKVDGGVTPVPSNNVTYFARWSEVKGAILLNAGSSGASFTQDQVDAYNAIAGHPKATFVNDHQIKLVYDVTTAAFSMTDVNLLPVLLGCCFDGWDPPLTSFDPGTVPPWDATSETYGQLSYTAKWSTNSYSISYEYVDQNGSALAGCETVDGSMLPLSFNEATIVRTLPSMKLRGYTWSGWTYEGSVVTSIPNVSGDVTLVAHFVADPYAIEVDLDGGNDDGWQGSGFSSTYGDPFVTLPANDGGLKKPGYVFRCFEAYTSEGLGPVYVYERGSTAPTKTLDPDKTYRILNLMNDDGDIYDVALLRAVWDVRIAVDVPSVVALGIMADFGTDSIRFRHGETVYTGDSENVHAPLSFASYTTAPIGIVEISDDMCDAQASERASLLQQAFKGNHGSVSMIVSSDKSLARHRLSFGGTTTLQSGSRYLEGLRVAAADVANDRPSTATFYLGMDFGALKAVDLASGLEGDIAKLSYTVTLLDDADEPVVDATGALAAYDGEGILW